MKITYIHQHFLLPSEGGGSRPYEFARRMARDGHEVTMICAGAEAMDATVDGIHVRRLSVPYRNEMNVPQRLVSFARFMVTASVAAARVPANLVFASSTPLTVAVPGVVAKLAQRAPLVFEVRDLWPEIPIELGYLTNPAAIALARALEKVAYRASAHVIALSPGMRDGVKKVRPSVEVTVVPNASDIETFDLPAEDRRAFRRAQGWADSETVVVYAGGFGKVYQLDWAVRLAAELKGDPIRFVLIGQGSESDGLRAQARDLGLDVDSLLPGRLPKTEVANYVAAANLVLSSMRGDRCLEAASLNKVFDAMAASRPLLLNHGGWLTDLVLETGAGWKLDLDIGTAAQQVREISRDEPAIQRAGEVSGELGKNEFARETLYSRLIGVLQSVARGSAR